MTEAINKMSGHYAADKVVKGMIKLEEQLSSLNKDIDARFEYQGIERKFDRCGLKFAANTFRTYRIIASPPIDTSKLLGIIEESRELSEEIKKAITDVAPYLAEDSKKDAGAVTRLFDENIKNFEYIFPQKATEAAFNAAPKRQPVTMDDLPPLPSLREVCKFVVYKIAEYRANKYYAPSTK